MTEHDPEWVTLTLLRAIRGEGYPSPRVGTQTLMSDRLRRILNYRLMGLTLNETSTRTPRTTDGGPISRERCRQMEARALQWIYRDFGLDPETTKIVWECLKKKARARRLANQEK